jgi:hypothetical protein
MIETLPQEFPLLGVKFEIIIVWFFLVLQIWTMCGHQSEVLRK